MLVEIAQGAGESELTIWMRISLMRNKVYTPYISFTGWTAKQDFIDFFFFFFFPACWSVFLSLSFSLYMSWNRNWKLLVKKGWSADILLHVPCPIGGRCQHEQHAATYLYIFMHTNEYCADVVDDCRPCYLLTEDQTVKQHFWGTSC